MRFVFRAGYSFKCLLFSLISRPYYIRGGIYLYCVEKFYMLRSIFVAKQKGSHTFKSTISYYTFNFSKIVIYTISSHILLSLILYACHTSWWFLHKGHCVRENCQGLQMHAPLGNWHLDCYNSSPRIMAHWMKYFAESSD